MPPVHTTLQATKYTATALGLRMEPALELSYVYKSNTHIKTLLLHIGHTSKHMVYETRPIGILLGLHLLSSLACILTTSTVIISLDNQATIRLLHIQKAKPVQYLLDKIHNKVELLHTKQDCLQQRSEFQKAKWLNTPIKAKTRGVMDLHIHWVPGHTNFEPNEKQMKPQKGQH